jgi:two-component system, chemotaxis family, chemotaxis protein CheY
MPDFRDQIRAISDRLESLITHAPEAAAPRVAKLAKALRSIAVEFGGESDQPQDASPENSPARRILLVDDDPVTQATLDAFLSTYGSVEFASTGEDAIAHIQAHLSHHPPDIVVLDIRLPGIDGHEVLRRIRALEAVHGDRFHPHVLMTSALDSKEHVVASLRMGASGYIVKPVQPDALARQMSAIGVEPLSRSA